MNDMHAFARILAVEPDRQSGDVLLQALDKRLDADVTVVQDVDAALTAIAEQVPDLILTSTFLPPAALSRLVDELRRRPDAAHTQIITTPHFLAPAADSRGGSLDRILRFPRQRTGISRFHCDPATLRAQIAAYLDQAIAQRAAARNTEQDERLITALAPAARPQDPAQPACDSSSLRIPTAQDLQAVSVLRPPDRRRASRRRMTDLAGEWAIRLNPHGDARIVDISASGVRLETSARLHPGSLIDLELIGIEGRVPVSARLIRTETVDSDGVDVKYRAAAMFLREIDLFALDRNSLAAAAAAESYTPKALADLLGRVLSDTSWVSTGGTLRSRFETELRALVRAREVRIRTVPVRVAGGCHSLYFNIPGTGAAEHALYIVFERGHRPSAAEFRLLKAAATLAALVIEMSPSRRRPRSTDRASFAPPPGRVWQDEQIQASQEQQKERRQR